MLAGEVSDLVRDHEPHLAAGEATVEQRVPEHHVAALPPELGETERELGEPDEGETDHPEQRPGADAPGGRLACEAGSVARVDREHDEERELREDEVGAQEPLVAGGAPKGGGAEL